MPSDRLFSYLIKVKVTLTISTIGIGKSSILGVAVDFAFIKIILCLNWTF